MKKVLLFVFILTSALAQAQNLIPNGSFDTFTACPSNLNELANASPWVNPTNSSPDYFNLCSTGGPCGAPTNLTGYQYPHSGSGYAGIVVKYAGNYREYLEVPLTAPLVAGTTYIFRMSVVTSNIYQDWTGDIGAYFSPTMVQVATGSPLAFTPQIRNSASNVPDTLNWMTVNGAYTAVGGEQYIVIGNFDDDAHTPSVHANASAPWSGTYVYIDDVSLTGTVTTGISEISSISFSAYPNPSTSGSEIAFNYPSSSDARDMVIHDATGKEIVRSILPPSSSHVTLPPMAKGIYVARMQEGTASAITRFIVE